MAERPASPGGALGRRLGRHAGIYSSGALITFALSLVNVAVLTRFLDLGEFGELAIALVFAATLTIIYNLGSLQGAFRWVFRADDEEAGDVADGAHEVGAHDPRRALTTAVAVTAAIAATGTVVVIAAAPVFRDVVGLHDTTVVELAAISGALGAIWRVVANVPRYERRPSAFVGLGALRPVLVLAVTIPLVASGEGIDGALLGMALGTAAAIAGGILMTRRNFRLALSREDAVQILRGGLPIVPIVVSLWVIQHTDMYLMSAFASDADLARYRVASRLGAGMSYFVSAFVLAWATIMHTSLYTAVERTRGPAAAGAVIVRWFVVVAVGITLGLAVLADGMIRIAPGEYAEAAPLIPLIALGFVAYGVFLTMYRGARFRNKRARYVQLLLATAALFLAIGIPLTAEFGGYGAALAQLVAFAITSGALILLAARADAPMPLEYGRLALTAALGLALFGAARLLTELAPDARIVFDLGAAVAFPVLVVVAGVIPRSELRALARRGDDRRAPVIESAWEREALELLVRDRRPPAEVARRLQTSETALMERVVGSLRTATGAGVPSELDDEIGSYLLSNRPVAERDAAAKRLWSAGADPLDLDRLELALARLRREGRARPRRARR